MSKFGGGSSSTNDQLIEEQKRQAEEAERREQERQNRLASGRARIKAMFSQEGGTYMTPETWGTTTETVTERQPIFATPVANNPNDRFLQGFFGRPVSGYENVEREITKEGWEPGEERTVAGIGQNFYDDFTNSVLGYYQPEVERQYAEAKDANLYDLARRGLLRSSVAAQNAEELIRERALADARVQSDAENQTAGLRGDIARAKQSALSMLEQSADPNSAADAAATEVNAIQSRSPSFSPLGELFSAAARSYGTWRDAQNRRNAYGNLPVRNPYASTGREVA